MTGQSLEGRVALITGAGRGIGAVVAEAFAAAGARIVIADRDTGPLNETCDAVGASVPGASDRLFAVPMDVSDAASIAEAIAIAKTRFGGIDIVMNNAALGPQLAFDPDTDKTRKFWEMPDDIWRATLSTNVLGPQFIAKALVPDMIARGWGRIINVTTSLATMYLPGSGAYGASKAALEAHSRQMALELAGTGVTVNILIPGGPVDTRMIDVRLASERDKLLQPRVMCAPAVWLASDASSACSGMRFIAARWEDALPLEERLAKAGAPAAWPQLGPQTIAPSEMRRAAADPKN